MKNHRFLLLTLKPNRAISAHLKKFKQNEENLVSRTITLELKMWAIVETRRL